MPYIGNQHNVGDHVNNFKVLDDISSHTATFDGSATSVVSVADDTIRIPEHRFIQGQRVTYTNGSGGNIGGLTTGTAYFVSFDTANTIKLATTLANANSNTVINLSAVGSGTSHTLNVAFDGVNTKFKMTHGSGKAARLNNATQLNVAINNVIQRPNQSALSFTEGFALEDNHKIVFKVAPTVNDIFWGSIIANTIENFDLRDNEVDNFTGDGSATEFTLSTIPANNESVMVTIDGVLQHPSDKNTTRAYTLINSIIQFTAAPALNAEIQVRHIGFAGASTADVSGFYGRTGNVALTSSDHITTGDITSRNINSSGIVTAATFDGSFSSGVGGSNANFTGIVTAGVFKGGDIEGRNLKITGLSTFVGDASFTGNVSIGGTLTYEDVTNIDSVGIITARDGIFLPDNKKLELGNASGSGDLQLYHNTTNSIIKNNTGELELRSNVLKILGNTGAEASVFNRTGSVDLTYNGVKTFETTNQGIKLTGTSNNTQVRLATSTGTVRGYLYANNVDEIYILDAQAHSILRGKKDGTAALYYNNQQKLDTTNTGINITGNVVGDGLTIDGNADLNGDLDVDGHTNLDNVSVAGIATFASDVAIGRSMYHLNDIDTTIGFPAANQVKITAGNEEVALFYNTGANINKKFNLRSSAVIDQEVSESSATVPALRIRNTGNHTLVNFQNTNSKNTIIQWNDYVPNGAGNLIFRGYNSPNTEYARFTSSGNFNLSKDLDVDGQTNLDNVDVVGIMTVSTTTQYHGYKLSNGTNLVGELVGLSGSNDTGALALWSGGYKKVQLSAVGSSYLTGGRVGIGTDNPQARLEIKDNISTNYGTTVRLSQSYNSVFSEIASNFGGSMTLNAGQGTSTAVMHFQVNDSEKMRLTNSGRLGIGTVTPSRRIHIHTEGSGSDYIQFTNSTTGVGSQDGYVFGISGDEDVIHNNMESTNIRWYTAGTERFRLTSNGNLLVGKTSDAGKGVEIYAANNAALRVQNSFTGQGAGDGLLIEASGTTPLIWNYENSDIRFGTNNTERLHIRANGDVYLNPTQGSTGVNSGAIRRFNAGLDYWSGTAGSSNAIKYAVHGAGDDNMYGMGISASLLELQSQVDIAFFAGSAGSGTGRRVERARISGTSGLFDVVGECRATNFYLRGNGSAPTADASIFRPADNCFAIATSSTERVRVTNDLVNIKGGNLHVGHDSATTNYTDSNLGNTRHIEIGATGGGDALLTTHCSGYGIGYFGYHSGGDRLVIACDQGGGNNSIDLITTAGTSNGGNTDNLHNKNPRFQVRGNGGFRAEYTDSNEVHAISNYDHGNNNYNHRGGRTLTSNGAGWDGNESGDGSDPILVLSVANRAGNSDIGDAYGIQLHSESQDNNDYGPIIGWSNRSNSGAYNTTYAAIVGQKTGQGPDSNWSSGALHFFTNKPGGYMDSTADLSIDEAGHVLTPRNSRFYALNNSGGADSANGGTGKISDYFETELVDSNGDYDTSNGRFTAPVDGKYEFHFAALHRAMSNAGSGELTFYKNGSNLSARSFGYSNIGSGGSSNDHQHLHIHGIFALSAGDYIEVYIYAQSPGMDFYMYQGLGYFSGKLLG